MIIFFDTEFTDLLRDARLISIGLVAENGQTFYAELTNTYQREQCSDFVKEFVLPHLEGGAARVLFHDLKYRLGEWLEGFRQPIKLATDSLEWDWPFVHDIFFDHEWPTNLDRRALILSYPYMDQVDKFNEAVEMAFASGLRRHHALDDAMANRQAWMVTQPGHKNGTL